MIDKIAIRRQLRRALAPTSRADYNKKYWPKWLENRLTTLAIYGYTDKEYEGPGDCDPVSIKCLREYQKGRSYDAIAGNLGLSRSTVQNYISRALSWVIDNTPDELLINVPVEHTIYRIEGCPHCKGTLIWSDDDACYWCSSCSREFTEDNKPVIKTPENIKI